MDRSARSSRSISKSSPDEDTEVPDKRAVDTERVGLYEFQEFGTALDPAFVGEHNREMARAREDVGERGKRPCVQLIDRLATRRCRPAVRRIRRDSMNGSRAQGRAPGIGDCQIGGALHGM